jgi:multisubunit Na+/H+ antiporter MnhC subunit
MPDRILRAVAIVACAVVAFIVAGGGFQKMTEDPAFRLAAPEHAAVRASSGTLRLAAILAGLAILAGALPLAWA